MGRTTAQKQLRSRSQTWHKDYATAVGDTTKAYLLFFGTLVFLGCCHLFGHFLKPCIFVACIFDYFCIDFVSIG